jgi:uncharacterized membrane protein YhaH (DUF805 family)
MNPYSRAMRNATNYQSRTSRAEFWLFCFLAYMLALIAYLFDQAFGTTSPHGGGLLYDLIMLFNIVPGLAIGVRRMHDTDHSGWWLLLPPVAFVFACLGSTPAANRFGPVPIPPTPRPRRVGKAPSIAPASAAAQPRDVVGEIERLAQLKTSGLLTDSEFEVMKAKALGQGGRA